MRRVVLSSSMAAGAMSRKFASSAGEMATSGVDVLVKPATIVQAGIAIAAALVGAGYALHTVDAKLGVMNATLEQKVASLTKEVDAKVAGVKETVTKEVAGALKEVDAKVAGVSDKAKAEALIVLKDYGVNRDPLKEMFPFGLARVCGTCNNPYLFVFPSSPNTVGVRRGRQGQQGVGPLYGL